LYDRVLDAAVIVGAVPARYADPAIPDVAGGLFRDGARQPGSPRHGNDQVVRYELPLHRRRIRAGNGASRCGTKPVEEFLEAKTVGLRTPAGSARPGFAYAAREDKRCGSRSRGDSHSAGRGLGGRPEATGICRRYLDTDRSAVSLPRPPSPPSGAVWPELQTVYFIDTRKQGLDRGTFRICAITSNGPSLPVAGLHLDLVRGPGPVDRCSRKCAGRAAAFARCGGWTEHLADGSGLRVGGDPPVCGAPGPRAHRDFAFLFPDAHPCRRGRRAVESQLESELRNWLAFARQKLTEVHLLACAAVEDSREIAEQLAENRGIHAGRRLRAFDPAVRDRVAGIAPPMFERSSGFSSGRKTQALTTPLPLLPTTTIG
jgi:hypothetical protein